MTRVGMLRFELDALVRKHHRQRIAMAKTKENAGTKAAAKAKRASAKAKKTRAAKDTAAAGTRDKFNSKRGESCPWSRHMLNHPG